MYDAEGFQRGWDLTFVLCLVAACAGSSRAKRGEPGRAENSGGNLSLQWARASHESHPWPLASQDFQCL